MSEVVKTDEGIFIPRDLIPDFDSISLSPEVDTSTSGIIIICIPTKAESRGLDDVLARIDQRRAAIFQRQGLLDDSTEMIREGRQRELR